MVLNKKIGEVLVVGGGIGGIQAALDLAEAGFKVDIVEKKSAIGGVMAQLDKTFPTNDCSLCILSPKLVEASRHPNIELITCAEVVSVDGEAGNFEVSVKKRPRYVNKQRCVGCGKCSEACLVRNRPYFEKKRESTYLEDEESRKIDKIIEAYYPNQKERILAILQDVQREYNYLPEDVIRYIAEKLDLPTSQLYHLCTFFSALSLKKRGRVTIKICMGTACHVRGAPSVLEALEKELGIGVGETTKDGKFTIEKVNCLGVCAVGPVVAMDGRYYGQMTPVKIGLLLRESL